MFGRDDDHVVAIAELLTAVGYSTIAFNLVLPTTGFDVKSLPDINPCHGAKPVFPDIDSRDNTSTPSTLQLSRVTITLDETSIAGGKGNGSLFVRKIPHVQALTTLIPQFRRLAMRTCLLDTT